MGLSRPAHDDVALCAIFELDRNGILTFEAVEMPFEGPGKNPMIAFHEGNEAVGAHHAG